MTLLSTYDFTIVYRPDKCNGSADFMSRLTEVNNTQKVKLRKKKEAKKIYNGFESDFAELILEFKNLVNHPTKDLTKEMRVKMLNYTYKANTLYRIKILYNDKIYLEVPSIKVRPSLLHIAHHDSGHFGMKATYDRLKIRYWWPSMAKQVQQFVSKCSICAENKPKAASIDEIIRTAPEGIFDRWGIDFVGPLPITLHQNQYILVMTEHVTKWAIATPTTDCTATAAAQQVFYHIVLNFGIPRHLISDRGSHFTGKILKKLAQKLGVKQIFTAPYSPQSNGTTEKLNQTLCNALKKSCQNSKISWDKIIYNVLW
jgi:hypothetical protein